MYSSKCGFVATRIWTSASVVTLYTRTSFPCTTPALVLLGTCAKHETPKKICKTYAKPKIPKKKLKKKRNYGQGQGPYLPGPGPVPGLGLAQARKGSTPALNPVDVHGVKRPRSLGVWLFSLRWVSAHLTSTFVTSCVIKVKVPPTSTTI
jgi:hypothetical protein